MNGVSPPKISGLVHMRPPKILRPCNITVTIESTVFLHHVSILRKRDHLEWNKSFEILLVPSRSSDLENKMKFELNPNSIPSQGNGMDISNVTCKFYKPLTTSDTLSEVVP